MFAFEESALNTFSPGLAQERRGKGWKSNGEVDIECRTLAEVLNEFCGGHIDFLDVDVEGLDYEVLLSNDWERFRPRFVCVEALQHDDDPTHSFLLGLGYRLIVSTGRSRIYG